MSRIPLCWAGTSWPHQSAGRTRTVPYTGSCWAEVKLPWAGTTDYRGEAASPDLQPGSGSWDGLATANTSFAGAFGAMVNTVGRFNGADDQGYARGHGLSSTAELFLVREGKSPRRVLYSGVAGP